MHTHSHIHGRLVFLSQELCNSFTIMPIAYLWPILKQFVGIRLFLQSMEKGVESISHLDRAGQKAHHLVFGCILQQLCALPEQEIRRCPHCYVGDAVGDQIKLGLGLSGQLCSHLFFLTSQEVLETVRALIGGTPTTYAFCKQPHPFFSCTLFEVDCSTV